MIEILIEIIGGIIQGVMESPTNSARLLTRAVTNNNWHASGDVRQQK